MATNYEFYLNADVTSYVGEWIAICGGQLVSHGKDVKRVLADAKKKCPRERPLITRVPPKEAMIF